MSRESGQLRREIAEARRSGRCPKNLYPSALREDVIRHARERVSLGESVLRIAGRLGMPPATLRLWMKGAGGTFREVEVVSAQGRAPERKEEGRGRIAVVTPGGFRVEGLGLAEVVDLLLALP